MTKHIKTTEQKQPGPSQIPQGYFVPIQISEPGDEISFLDLWRVLVDIKMVVAVVVLLSLALSIVVSFSITPMFRAEVLLAPAAKDSKSSGISALTSQFGGLADLAGVSFGGGGGDIETAIATLKSRKFITRFITDLGIKPILFERQWDKKNNQWIFDDPLMLSKNKSSMISPQKISPLQGLAPGEPSQDAAYKQFSQGMLNVSQDKKTQLVTVSIDWKNPQQAAKWANILVNRLNEELRRKTINEAERSIAYLREQISQTSLSELQNVLYRIIEEHIKIITLANVNDEYMFKVIDPAVPPETRFKPNRKLIVIVGLSLGAILGVFSALFLNAVRKWREREEHREE